MSHTMMPIGDQTSTSAAEPAPRPFLLVRGVASPEELAALIAVLAVVGRAAPEATAPHTSAWASRERLLRTPHSHGSVGWRASTLPH